MLVIQRRFSVVICTETDACPTLENAMGAGGNNIPMVIMIIKHEKENERKDKPITCD